MAAFFSATDDASELTNPGIHITIGALNRPNYQIASSVTADGRRFLVSHTELIDFDNQPAEKPVFHEAALTMINQGLRIPRLQPASPSYNWLPKRSRTNSDTAIQQWRERTAQWQGRTTGGHDQHDSENLSDNFTIVEMLRAIVYSLDNFSYKQLYNENDCDEFKELMCRLIEHPETERLLNGMQPMLEQANLFSDSNEDGEPNDDVDGLLADMAATRASIESKTRALTRVPRQRRRSRSSASTRKPR